MNLHTICILLFSAVLLGGCSSSKKKSQQPESNQEEMAETEKPVPPVAPAPGTVHVTAEVLSLEAVENGFHCQLRIVSADAYGSNTKPLPEGTEIVASLSKDVMTAAQQNEEETATMKAGTTQYLTLRYQRVPDMPGMTAMPWRVLSIR